MFSIDSNLALRSRLVRLFGACSAGLVAVATILVTPGSVTSALAVDASSQHIRIPVGANYAPEVIRLGLNKSIVVDLPRAAKDVLVSDPTKADAVMRTPRRAYVIGMNVGQTNIFFFDEAGRQILSLELQIERDLAALNSMYRRLLPGSSIKVDAINENVVLSGSVTSNEDAARAADLAARFAGDPAKVVNMLAVEGKDQVLLKVTIAEVQRSASKQFGINFDALLNQGTDAVFQVISDNPFNVAGKALSSTGAFTQLTPGNHDILANIRLMEQNGLLRTLAEPTLAAISGETASFLAGGEFPIPVGLNDNKITIEFKQFGVSLGFTPVVLSEGRISLKIKTEVSEISNEGAFALGNAVSNTSLAIPSLKVRRAETTVEMPSGGALVIAGLLRDDVAQGLSGLPGAKDMPVLGALFRSRDFQSDQTELVVLVTPYLAEPTSRKNISLPTDRLAPSSDYTANVIGRLNQLYGVQGAEPQGQYQGNYGFVVQ